MNYFMMSDYAGIFSIVGNYKEKLLGTKKKIPEVP